MKTKKQKRQKSKAKTQTKSRAKSAKHFKFIDWLLDQTERDDLIGDIAYDTQRVIELKKLTSQASYKSIYEYTETSVFLNSLNKNILKEVPLEEIEEFNKETMAYYDRNDKTKFYCPLYCLELAKKEFDNTWQRPIGCVYFVGLKNDFEELVKIGFSKHTDANKRMQSIQTSVPYELNLLGTIETNDYNALEKELHEKYKDLRKRGEWFKIAHEEIKLFIKRSQLC